MSSQTAIAKDTAQTWVASLKHQLTRRSEEIAEIVGSDRAARRLIMSAVMLSRSWVGQDGAQLSRPTDSRRAAGTWQRKGWDATSPDHPTRPDP